MGRLRHHCGNNFSLPPLPTTTTTHPHHLRVVFQQASFQVGIRERNRQLNVHPEVGSELIVLNETTEQSRISPSPRLGLNANLGSPLPSVQMNKPQSEPYPQKKQRLLTPSGDTNDQLTIRASKIKLFCFFPLLTKKIREHDFGVPFGRGRRSPTSSNRVKSCSIFVRFLLIAGGPNTRILQLVARAFRCNITETKAPNKFFWKKQQLDSSRQVHIQNEIPATRKQDKGLEQSWRMPS